MNSQLIEKVIKTHCKTCPSINYNNPLIDREVASALSKSFMKILDLSKERNINNSLRTAVLNSIKKIIQLEPEKHLKVDENITNLLTDLYVKVIEDRVTESNTDKNLDVFLMRRAKDISLTPINGYSVNPETVQSLLNFQESCVLECLLENIIHLEDSHKNLVLLRNLWNNKSSNFIIYDDLSIKLKCEIEHTLLEICHKILIDKDLNLEDLFETDSLRDLTMKCSKSTNCFQICCNILNYLLIETSFNLTINNFIPLFINKVQSYYNFETISILYSAHLSRVVLLMDIDINSLPDNIKNDYIQKVVTLLRNIESQNDVIMLLSHYQNWFDIYFN